MTLVDILHLYRKEDELKIILPDDRSVRLTPVTALKYLDHDLLNCKIKEIEGNYDQTIDIVLYDETGSEG